MTNLLKSFLVCICIAFVSCSGNNETEKTSEETTVDFEELEKSDQEKSDSVLNAWKEKMNPD